MLTTCWRRAAAIGCVLMTCACAPSRVTTQIAPPRLAIPPIADTPCGLARLPAEPTQADLEVAYMTRGAQLVACDAARQAALETLLHERRLIDAWSQP